jgi:DNA-binding MarR family transcriptional regulator
VHHPIVKPAVRTPRELLESSAFLVKRLGNVAKEQTMRAFTEAGSTPYSYAVLAVLEEGARETQATIADALGYDRSYLVGLLDELESHALIERRRDPADRRRHLVNLTPAGEKELVRLRTVHAAIDGEVFGALTDDERDTLHALLWKVAAGNDPRYAVEATAQQ